MGRERPSGCCVILRSRFIGATFNLAPLCFMSDDDGHRTSFISHSLPVSGSHLVSAFSYYYHPVIVRSASSSPALGLSYVHTTFLSLTLRCEYFFYLTLLLASVYILP